MKKYLLEVYLDEENVVTSHEKTDGDFTLNEMRIVMSILEETRARWIAHAMSLQIETPVKSAIKT